MLGVLRAKNYSDEAVRTANTTICVPGLFGPWRLGLGLKDAWASCLDLTDQGMPLRISSVLVFMV